MEFKLFFLLTFSLPYLPIIFVNTQILSCEYTISGAQYNCYLTIQNPNGLNNFQTINGTHLVNKSDDDVTRIYKTSGSVTKNIPSIICEKFKNLLHIDLEQIQIQMVDENSFSGCKKIQHITLTSNRITEVNENAFKQNSELNFLSLWQNQLSNLSETIFSNQQKLGLLWLDINQFQDFPDKIFHPLINLYELHLDTNQLTSIKIEWFETLEKLTVLALERNKIEELPRNVFSPLKILNTLALFNNNIKIIHSDSFSVHPSLEIVNLNNNQIDAIDEMFINNTGISTIHMSNNKCANKTITDSTLAREFMRAELKKCFENYEALMAETTTNLPSTTTSLQTLPPGCEDENISERVCTLEGNIGKLREENSRFKIVTEQQQAQIDDLSDENGKLKEQIQAHDSQIKNILKSLDELENKVLELTTYPCICK